MSRRKEDKKNIRDMSAMVLILNQFIISASRRQDVCPFTLTMASDKYHVLFPIKY